MRSARWSLKKGNVHEAAERIGSLIPFPKHCRPRRTRRWPRFLIYSHRVGGAGDRSGADPRRSGFPTQTTPWYRASFLSFSPLPGLLVYFSFPSVSWFDTQYTRVSGDETVRDTIMNTRKQEQKEGRREGDVPGLQPLTYSNTRKKQNHFG